MDECLGLLSEIEATSELLGEGDFDVSFTNAGDS